MSVVANHTLYKHNRIVGKSSSSNCACFLLLCNNYWCCSCCFLAVPVLASFQCFDLLGCITDRSKHGDVKRLMKRTLGSPCFATWVTVASMSKHERATFGLANTLQRWHTPPPPPPRGIHHFPFYHCTTATEKEEENQLCMPMPRGTK